MAGRTKFLPRPPFPPAYPCQSYDGNGRLTVQQLEDLLKLSLYIRPTGKQDDRPLHHNSSGSAYLDFLAVSHSTLPLISLDFRPTCSQSSPRRSYTALLEQLLSKLNRPSSGPSSSSIHPTHPRLSHRPHLINLTLSSPTNTALVHQGVMIAHLTLEVIVSMRVIRYVHTSARFGCPPSFMSVHLHRVLVGL